MRCGWTRWRSCCRMMTAHRRDTAQWLHRSRSTPNARSADAFFPGRKQAKSKRSTTVQRIPTHFRALGASSTQPHLHGCVAECAKGEPSTPGLIIKDLNVLSRRCIVHTHRCNVGRRRNLRPRIPHNNLPRRQVPQGCRHIPLHSNVGCKRIRAAASHWRSRTLFECCVLRLSARHVPPMRLCVQRRLGDQAAGKIQTHTSKILSLCILQEARGLHDRRWGTNVWHSGSMLSCAAATNSVVQRAARMCSLARCFDGSRAWSTALRIGELSRAANRLAAFYCSSLSTSLNDGLARNRRTVPSACCAGWIEWMRDVHRVVIPCGTPHQNEGFRLQSLCVLIGDHVLVGGRFARSVVTDRSTRAFVLFVATRVLRIRRAFPSAASTLIGSLASFWV